MNMDLYNHGTLGVAATNAVSLGSFGALRGLGYFANHRSKIQPLHAANSPPEQNSGKDNTAQGK